MSETSGVLTAGIEVPFSEIDAALQREGAQASARGAPSLMATVVAIGPDHRLGPAATALQELADCCAVRSILISPGSNPSPPVRVSGRAIALAGLKANYVNNAVAALRLSSLPTLVWFRGGAGEILNDLAQLADRLVLDEEQPIESWRRAQTLLDRTAFSDVRWARLTRWRALMAHFFDIPQVREAARAFTRLRISGPDRVAALLYAGWLETSLSLPLELEFRDEAGGALIEEIRLGDADHYLLLRLAGKGTCLHTAAIVSGHRSSSRTVALGDDRLASVIAEELRIRARDPAFERAAAAATAAP